MKKTITLFMLFTIIFACSMQGQNQANMYYSGEMNNWGADLMEYRLLGIPTWKTTILSNDDDTSSEFKFRDSDSNYDHEWTYGSLVNFDTKTTFATSGNNSSINETNTNYYTFTWVDVPDLSQSFVYVMETSAEPVSINDVSQSPDENNVAEDEDVIVTTETDTAPCDEEHFYVRYTYDDWLSSALAELDFGDFKTTTGTATIPSQNSAEKNTSYYVFSTTDSNPTSDFDIKTIEYDNNSNTNYAYATLHSSTQDGDWHTASTWSSGVVPASDDDVLISHIVTVANSAAEINNITVEGGASLTFSAGVGHTIHGSVWVYGNARVNNGSFIDITGYLWIMPTTGNLAVRAGGELTVGGNTINSGTFTIESSSTATGSFIPEGSVLGSNGITVERYIGAWSDAAHGWHMLSSPVTVQAIQPEFVPNPPTTNEDFYSWGETTDEWINTESSSGVWNTGFENDFMIGKGYLVAYGSDLTKDFSGLLNNLDVTKSGLTYTASSDHTGWNLLGNPYASALYWNQTAWALSNVDGTAKVWDESSASYTDIVAVTGVLPAMQGFMVHVTGSGTGSLIIDATDRIHNSQNWHKDAEINHIVLIAYDTEGNTAQESNIRVDENATTGFDSSFDSWFLAGYAPQFYSVIPEGALSTNVLPEITTATKIPMSFIKNASSTYRIEAEGVNNLVPQETVYLTDLKTNHTQNMNNNPVYSFTSEEGDMSDRFVVHFSPLAVEEININDQVNVFSSNGNVEIRSNKPIDAKINIYNLAGQLINSNQLVNENNISIGIPNYKGTVIVSIITPEQTLTKKLIIW